MSNGSRPGLDTGVGSTSTDTTGLFLKVFSGEVLAAFQRSTVATNNVITRTITSGKSAQFPVLGRAAAKLLTPGNSLDDQRTAIKNTEKVITIDGLLSADCLIYDMDSFQSAYDFRSVYSNQLGEALSQNLDAAILAEIAKLANTAAASINGLGAPAVVSMGEKPTTQAGIGQKIIDGLLAASATLDSNYVPAAQRVAYVTPNTYNAILSALGPNSAQYQTIGDLGNATLTNVSGFTVVKAPTLTAGTTEHVFPTTGEVTASNVACLIAHQSSVGVVKIKDISIEQARRPEYQADQIISTMSVGVGGLRNEAVGALVFEEASA